MKYDEFAELLTAETGQVIPTDRWEQVCERILYETMTISASNSCHSEVFETMRNFQTKNLGYMRQIDEAWEIGLFETTVVSSDLTGGIYGPRATSAPRAII